MNARAPSLGRERPLAIQQRALRDCIAMIGGSAPDSLLLERDGVAAAIVPASPRRSIPNSVVYTKAGALAGELDELASVYDEAGVDAWTVWTPDFDSEAIAALEAAGHRFDGGPLAMVCDLERFEPPDLGGLDYDDEGEMSELGRLNDVAYGYVDDPGFAPVLVHRPEGLDLRVYRARFGGELASVLATIDHRPLDGAAGPDCGIYFVATPDEHRGRFLATRLLAAALVEARGRGCATSSLQSSAMGEPIYRRLGYEPCFRLYLYERRRPTT
jgi:GNAT superfamily N-acetyltransferase